MNFIFGLGNPGEKYAHTRHNIGFMLVDVLKDSLSNGQQISSSQKFSSEVYQFPDLLLIKPQTYMNDSGRAVRAAIDFYKEKNFEHIFVAHDDLDLQIGSYKIQLGKGPKVHNGLSSIYAHLSSANFWHIRLGVDGRGGVRNTAGKDYVLSGFSSEEKVIVDQMLAKVQEDVIKRLS